MFKLSSKGFRRHKIYAFEKYKIYFLYRRLSEIKLEYLLYYQSQLENTIKWSNSNCEVIKFFFVIKGYCQEGTLILAYNLELCEWWTNIIKSLWRRLYLSQKFDKRFRIKVKWIQKYQWT